MDQDQAYKKLLSSLVSLTSLLLNLHKRTLDAYINVSETNYTRNGRKERERERGLIRCERTSFQVLCNILVLLDSMNNLFEATKTFDNIGVVI